jgi:PHP family Zn ribbon phosphoesterase
MTPANIVGHAKLSGLHFAAVSDHNAIANVPAALKAGEEYGVKIVPAIELQTNEDIHLLCLFETYGQLESFFDAIRFSQRPNRKDIFGQQLVMDEDDNVLYEEQRMLLDSADISSDEAYLLAEQSGGIAVPAHIDREMNGMLAILGDIDPKFRTVEMSALADESAVELWRSRRTVLVNSDAHTLEEIIGKGEIELDEYSVKAFLDAVGRKG